MSPGFFLAVEGPDGAGKTTLATALAQRFRTTGTEAILVREPGGTPVAERVRELLLDPTHTIEPASELFLFLAARAELVAKVIRPAVEAGLTVVADRFQLSTEAYQCGGRGLNLQLVREANRAATGGMDPDLTLVLDVASALGFERILKSGQSFDRMERAGPEFHSRVAQVFRNATGPGVIHLDASLASEQVLRAAWGEIESRRPGAPGVLRD